MIGADKLRERSMMDSATLGHKLAPGRGGNSDELRLDSGSRVAVLGGGPAGSFFSYFFLETAHMMGLDVEVDIYEWRDFSRPSPQGCNMCGGVISESLAQMLAVEGLNLPPTVVQRGIDSYVLHMDAGAVRIQTPLQEKRIAVVHRGSGPRDIKESKWRSFDGFLLDQAVAKGAQLIRLRADGVVWEDSRPRVATKEGTSPPYDLLVVASGVNTATLKLFEHLRLGFTPPQTTKTYICELSLGHERVERHLGSSMHVFLLDIPRIEFAALIPKGDYVTVCLLGHDIDAPLVQTFLQSSQVRSCLPPDWQVPPDLCHCSPRINIEAAIRPYADRIVFIGDCGVSRLYKDGIGAAYRTAKAASSAAAFHGVSAGDFHRHYWPACLKIANDNRIGKLIFAFTRQIQRLRLFQAGVLRMVSREQDQAGSERRMSGVMWDVFTGSAPYKDVFMRTLSPIFLARLLRDTIGSMTSRKGQVTAGGIHADGSAG